MCLCVAGDLKDEEALLEWLIDNKDVGPASIIEEVDGQMLQNLVDTFEYLVVYFCEYHFTCLWEGAVVIILCFILFILCFDLSSCIFFFFFLSLSLFNCYLTYDR